MRVSPKKRAANRRNALKSTGPKTVAGRRASAQNAIHHGLSVPLPPELVEPVRRQLVQLIMLDGFDHEAANNLAEKIIEYECNIKYLNDIFQNEILLQYALDDSREAVIRQPKKEQEKLINYLAEIEQVELELKSRQICRENLINKLQFLSQVKEACQGMIYRIEKMPDINRAANAQRYFKRASNQLIKALKRL